jgi:hypothetical protein
LQARENSAATGDQLVTRNKVQLHQELLFFHTFAYFTIFSRFSLIWWFAGLFWS